MKVGDKFFYKSADGKIRKHVYEHILAILTTTNNKTLIASETVENGNVVDWQIDTQKHFFNFIIQEGLSHEI